MALSADPAVDEIACKQIGSSLRGAAKELRPRRRLACVARWARRQYGPGDRQWQLREQNAVEPAKEDESRPPQLDALAGDGLWRQPNESARCGQRPERTVGETGETPGAIGRLKTPDGSHRDRAAIVRDGNEHGAVGEQPRRAGADGAPDDQARGQGRAGGDEACVKLHGAGNDQGNRQE